MTYWKCTWRRDHWETEYLEQIIPTQGNCTAQYVEQVIKEAYPMASAISIVPIGDVQ